MLRNVLNPRNDLLDNDSMEKQSVKVIHDKLKVHSLTGRITEELMLKAFKAVKKNRGHVVLTGYPLKCSRITLKRTCYRS